MTTAVDTNVLLDVFFPDDRFGPSSRAWLQDARGRGAVLVSAVVYAELIPAFNDHAGLDEALAGVGANISSIDTTIAYEAGLRWSRYRRAGGSRTRIISDFLIGAHALLMADVFLTRDQGFFSTYFPELDR